MKGLPFLSRLGFAVNGWKEAFNNETSFRTQIFAAALAITVTAIISPQAIWWALILLVIALILAAELFNTALERTLDGLHPKEAEFIKHAKDCAAGAVLVLSCVSIGIFVLMIRETYY